MTERFGSISESRYTLDSRRYWDVKVSRRIPGLGGLVSGKFAADRRRISIEICKPATVKKSSSKETFLDKSQRSMGNIDSRPHNGRRHKKLLSGLSRHGTVAINDLGDHDIMYVRIFKAKTVTEEDFDHPGYLNDDDFDAKSIGSMPSASDSASESKNIYDKSTPKITERRWVEQFECRLDNVDVIKSSEKSCRLKLKQLQKGTKSSTRVRTVQFQSKEENDLFLKSVAMLKKLRKERAERLAHEYKQSVVIGSERQSSQVPGIIGALRIKPEPNTTSSEVTPRFISFDSVSNLLGSSPTRVTSLMSSTINGANRMASRVTSVFSSRKDGHNEHDSSFEIDLLIEIVSACNLPTTVDVKKSGTHVKVYDGHKAIHTTKNLTKTLNPVWTLATGSLFLLRSNAVDFFNSTFLAFVIRSDTLGGDETLGTVYVNKEDLLNGTGQRLEYEFVDRNLAEVNERPTRALYQRVKSRKHLVDDDSTPPTLALRFKRATKREMLFLQEYHANKKQGKKGVFSGDALIPPKVNNVLSNNQPFRKHGKGQEYRVKPNPDPKRPDETMWMAEEEINNEMSKPSHNWMQIGAGDLGRLYCEVLCCDGLPNLDFSITGRNKTDPFVSLVFEDSIVYTDVIFDVLSPRWLPWTQRAFVFPIMHPASQLQIGVFDYDVGTVADDTVGRASVNITNFHPGSVYTVKYNLHSVENDNTVRGSITLRIRVEWDNERAALLRGFGIDREPFKVALHKQQLFHTVHQTISSEPNPSVLKLSTFLDYIWELWGWLDYSEILEENIKSIILWKSYFPLILYIPTFVPSSTDPNTSVFAKWTKPVKIFLPVRSMIAFAWGIALSRNFELFPSFLAFCPAWLLLNILILQNHRPCPWQHPRSYFDLLSVLVFNKSKPRKIKSYENFEKSQEYDRIQEFIKKAKNDVYEATVKESTKFYSEAEQDNRDMGVSKANFSATEVSSKAKGDTEDFYLAPFASTLLPLQLMLHKQCVRLRIAKSILLWRDSYSAFWITTASFITSLIFLWVPWTFVLKSIFKIFVWTFLGPWMKLVDIFYVRHKLEFEKSEEELKQDLADDLKEVSDQWSGFSKNRRIVKEKLMKDRVIREYMYGKYLLNIPVNKTEATYYDPLPESSADTSNIQVVRDADIVFKAYGQDLKGDMIPKRTTDRELEEREEKGITFEE